MENPGHIVISGASSGIGAMLALHYAATGVTLSLTGRDKTRLEQVATQARGKGAKVHAATGDVTDGAFVESWIKLRDTDRPIDLVIANAGISPGLKTGEEKPQDVSRVFNTNILGVMNTIQPAIALMKGRGRGQIALMTSLAGFRGLQGGASYCASKATIRVYGEALRADLAPHGIAVNVICPGFIDTPMTEHNPFPMPLKLSAYKAVTIIIKGLARNRARISFPWPVYLLVMLVTLLPQDLMNRLIAHLRKSAAPTVDLP